MLWGSGSPSLEETTSTDETTLSEAIETPAVFHPGATRLSFRIPEPMPRANTFVRTDITPAMLQERRKFKPVVTRPLPAAFEDVIQQQIAKLRKVSQGVFPLPCQKDAIKPDPSAILDIFNNPALRSRYQMPPLEVEN